MNNEKKGAGLLRALGPLMGTAVVVGTVIGSGVFKKPQVVAENVPYFGVAGLAWLCWERFLWRKSRFSSPARAVIMSSFGKAMAGWLASCGAGSSFSLSAAPPWPPWPRFLPNP
jgi:hypothetical protein